MGRKNVTNGLLAYKKLKANGIINAANSLSNLFDDLKISKDHCIYSCPNHTFTTHIYKVTELDEKLVDQLFLLLQSNMQVNIYN